MRRVTIIFGFALALLGVVFVLSVSFSVFFWFLLGGDDYPSSTTAAFLTFVLGMVFSVIGLALGIIAIEGAEHEKNAGKPNCEIS